MDSADLSINQAEADRNSFVKLFNINGRVLTASSSLVTLFRLLSR